MRLALVLAAAMLPLSCSFTTATGFDECMTDTDCASDSICIRHYCIKMPQGCRRGAGAFNIADHVAFGAVMPLTDTMGNPDQGQNASLNAYTMAVDEMNIAGGASGMRKFALYVCDQGQSSDLAVTQAAFLGQQAKVPAVLSAGSAQALSVSAATRDAGTLTMSPRATSPLLVDEFHTVTNDLLWRTAPPDTLQGRVLANLLLNDPAYAGATKIGIIYVGDAYGTGLQNELSSRLRGSRTVQGATFMSGDDAGTASAVMMIANFAPKATVVIANSLDVKAVLTDAFTHAQLQRASGHKWAFADGARQPVILTAPNAVTELSGSLGTAPAQGAGVIYPTFHDAYVSRFMDDPGKYAYTSHSYDAMYLLGIAASYATSGGRSLNGATMATAMNLVSAGSNLTIQPSSFPLMINAMTTGTSIDVEGNSGSLDFIPDAGAPYAKIEEWSIAADGGITTVRLIDPTTIN
jgi:branched-chain amino acid transport system substrate-binding protein